MTLGMCICQAGPYFCMNFAVHVHNFSTPLAMDSFLHAKSKIHAAFLSSSTSSNPVTTFFTFSINSSLSPSHALHLIRKCFTSSTSPLLHSVHFLSSLLKPLHLPPPPARSYAVPPPPPPSFISILLIFFLLTPRHTFSFKSSSNKLF